MFRKLDRGFHSIVDWQVVLLALMICAISLVVLASAGNDPETGASLPMKRQAAAMGFGFVVLIFCSVINPSFWQRSAYLIYGAVLTLLIAVEVKGVYAGGARRWLDLGAIRIQPSEFAKIAVILVLARLFSSAKYPKEGYSILTMIGPCLLIAVPMLLVVLQPDLGTGMSIGLVGGSMLLYAGVQRKTLIRLGTLALLSLFPIWRWGLKDYQRLRILNFLHPETDPLGSGYHALQSQIAVGSGSVAGKGFLKGTQTQLRFLPEQTTDFIFSVLAEEWGFVGSVSLIIIYAFLVLKILKVASKCSEPFSSYVCFGVAALLFWHVTLNIGMVIGIVPVVGITLPLLSYGGSSVVTILTGLGLVSSGALKRFVFAR
jgi:rod shape determining protein RodA